MAKTNKPQKSSSLAAPKKRVPTKKSRASEEDRDALLSSLDALMGEIARLDAADVDTHGLRNSFLAVRLNVALFLEGDDEAPAPAPVRKRKKARRAKR